MRFTQTKLVIDIYLKFLMIIVYILRPNNLTVFTNVDFPADELINGYLTQKILEKSAL